MPREFVLRHESPELYVEFLRANYGPTVTAFEALGPDGGKQLYDDLVALVSGRNVATDGTLKIPSAYLQVLAVRA